MKKSLVILSCFFAVSICVDGQGNKQYRKGFPDKNPELDILPGFINPPEGYGNVPFYWWNGDSLKKERISEQLDILSESATDGFAVSYIHTSPRIDTLENMDGYGLYGMTEPGAPQVFSDDWWEIWNWFSRECSRRGLGAGLDDYTVGWHGNRYYPDELDTMSVFAGCQGEIEIKKDTVLDGNFYQANVSSDNILAIVAWPGGTDLLNHVKKGRIHWKAPNNKTSYVYTITTKPGYVIHPEHGKRLIDVYFNRFESRMDQVGRNGMNYFFQDELSYPIKIGSWSDDFAEEFRKRKGYDIIRYLPALKDNIGDITPKIRIDYCEVLMDLAEERYFKPIYQWHADRGLIYGCDNLGRGKDPTAYIDYFRAVSWFTAPGNDAPSRGSSFIETKISSSITHLYGRPRTWLEAFHSMGWGSSGAWLTRQIDHHFIAGGNLVCMHGLYYSTHGGWWEWAPPDFHFRMPYWPHMKQWLDYTQRMSYLLSHGSHVCDVAILYPTESLQAYPGTKPDSVFNTAMRLSNSGIDYDFIDSRSLRNADISGNMLKMADEQYRIIVLVDIWALHHDALQKIVDFYRSGGIVLAAGNLPKATTKQGENVREVNGMVREMFGVDANDDKRKVHRQENSAGGIGMYVSEMMETVIPELITTDFRPAGGKGKVLHKKIGRRDVYMVTDVEKGTECFFRATGKVELWDANTTQVEPYPVLKQTEKGTWLQMNKNQDNSYLIVFSPGTPLVGDVQAPSSVKVEEIPVGGEWEIELKPTLDNKWGDYRLPATEGMIAAEARSFRYAPDTQDGLDWTAADFNDASWPEEFDGYGPQYETCSDGTDWVPVSFSWRYGVWNNPGAQGYHGLKGKIDDRFFILDKGGDQQIRTYVYAPKNDTYKIEQEGVFPVYIRINGQKVGASVFLPKGWHRLEVSYSRSEKVDFAMQTGHTRDDRLRGFVVLYPSDVQVPKKPSRYSSNLSSRWGEEGHLMFDPYGGKYDNWRFRFKTVPGLEDMTFEVYGRLLGVWLDGKEIKQDNIILKEQGENWNRYLVRLEQKQEHTVNVAFLVQSDKGYQGCAVMKDLVKLHTSTGLMLAGDWALEGSLKYYSGGMLYRKQINLENIENRKIVLDLGEVLATCEVKVNSQSAGILISPPYQSDITKLVRKGINEVEVLVYSTLSNHYQTIPTPYKGDPKAGLIGPVKIVVE